MVTEDKRIAPKWLKPTTEYGPIVIFFIAYYTGDLFVATGAIMIATLIALVVSYLFERKIPMMPLVTAIIIGVFGGLTIWLKDETFIKMKPTIIQTLFGLALLTGLAFDKLILKSVLGAIWQLPRAAWRTLTLRFALFFFVMAILNEVIWRTQTTDFWVNFKVFGLMGLTFVFFILQASFVQANLKKPDPTSSPD